MVWDDERSPEVKFPEIKVKNRKLCNLFFFLHGDVLSAAWGVLCEDDFG